MKKLPLTPTGVSAFMASLYRLDDAAIAGHAASLADDPRAWIAAHFELSVNQLELVRSLTESFISALGWGLAAAVITRRPFLLKDEGDAIGKNLCTRVGISFDSGLSARYDHQARKFTAAGIIEIALHKPDPWSP